MINKQANILFIPTSISGNSAEPQVALSRYGFYQQLIYPSLARSTYKLEGLQVLARRLEAIAQHAYLARHMDVVEHASQVMLALPIADRLENVVRYYQALCKRSHGDIVSARQALERVVEEASPKYRARALQVIGLTYHECGEVDAALHFYLLAGKAAANCDLSTLVETRRVTAVVRSIHGDHKQALKDLETLFPLTRAIGKYFPSLYHDLLNSLAVELGEVGRVTEAEAACAIALASPFARAYPEWSETRDEIAAKRVSATRSVVAFNRAPEAAPSPQAAPERKPKPVGRRALNWPSRKKTFLQRAFKTIAATSAIPHDGITQSILDRVLICIGPRAPPASA